MLEKKCYVCGKTPLTKDEVGLTKKLINKKATWGVFVRWVNQYILEDRIPGCERIGLVWAVPEDAVKPKRLAPGVKAKRSSSVQNAARNIQE